MSLIGPDPSALKAIDVHVHVARSAHAEGVADHSAEVKKYFRNDDIRRLTADEVAAYYRERQMACVAFRVDKLDNVRGDEPSNEEIAEAAARNSDVMMAFGSVHPDRGKIAVQAVDRLVQEHGVKGFKFHPITQRFQPNDPTYFPLYAAIEAAGSIAMFHTGLTGIGAGEPGGGRYLLKYGDPMLLDEVAAQFPGLRIIMAHPSFPWQDEALAVALHKPNAYIDLSGWSPKYFPDNLVRHADTLLRDKCLFGSDFPLIKPERWLEDFAKLPVRAESRDKILLGNATKLLGLGPAEGAPEAAGGA